MTSVATNVTSVISRHFPFDDDFFALGQKENMITDSFISVMQACSTITANFVLISWFSRSDKFMKPLLTILSLGCYLL